MEGTVLLMLLATSSIAVVFSSPIAIGHINYDNVPQCMQPSESGLCLAYIPSFFYNSAKGTCESFIFGGCKGNQNRFFSFDECMSTCGGFKPKKDATFKLRLESDSDLEKELAKEIIETSPQEAGSDICSQPPVMGPCRAMMPRLYFNGLDCEFFVYGGCQGNGNNFKTVEECKQACASKSAESSSDAGTSAEETSDASSEEKGEENPSVAETSAEATSDETSDVSTEEKGESSAGTDEKPEASTEKPTKETSEESSSEAKVSTEQ